MAAAAAIVFLLTINFEVTSTVVDGKRQTHWSISRKASSTAQLKLIPGLGAPADVVRGIFGKPPPAAPPRPIQAISRLNSREEANYLRLAMRSQVSRDRRQQNANAITTGTTELQSQRAPQVGETRGAVRSELLRGLVADATARDIDGDDARDANAQLDETAAVVLEDLDWISSHRGDDLGERSNPTSTLSIVAGAIAPDRFDAGEPDTRAITNSSRASGVISGGDRFGSPQSTSQSGVNP